MAVVDVHAHIIVPQITRSFDPSEGWRPAVTWENGRQYVDFGGKKIKANI